MTLRHANVSAAPPSDPGWRDRRRYPTNPHRARQERWAVLPVGPFRPASRGSAKPAPMTLRHANVSAAPSSSPGGDLRPAPLPTGPRKPRIADHPSGPYQGEGASLNRVKRARQGRWAVLPVGPFRPASRGSAKPAPMTLRHANVSAAPPSNPGGRDRRRYPKHPHRARQRKPRTAHRAQMARDSGDRVSLITPVARTRERVHRQPA